MLGSEHPHGRPREVELGSNGPIYNGSYKCLCGSPGKYGTRQQGGAQAFSELMGLIYETGSSAMAGSECLR
jgi:hypothetical protein